MQVFRIFRVSINKTDEILLNSHTLYDVFFINQSIGWVIGEKGTILHYNENLATHSPDRFENNNSLKIFPNPVSLLLNIDINMFEEGTIEVAIFDLMGNRNISFNLNISF